MKDVSLDDLIKEDKAKNKTSRPKKGNVPAVSINIVLEKRPHL